MPLLADDEEEAVRLATERARALPRALRGGARARPAREARARRARSEGDRALAADLLGAPRGERASTTRSSSAGSARAAADPVRRRATSRRLFAEPGAFHDWAEAWRRRLAEEDVAPEARASAMRHVNPAFIPRNHRVEEAIEAAVRRDDFAPFETLVRVLARPYDDQPEFAYLAEPPAPEERVRATFCGT